MQTIRHTISDDLLMGYAAGVLSRPFDLVVATHVSLSDEARVRLAGFEAVGGAILEDLQSADVADDSLEQTMARIAGMKPSPRLTASRGIFPAPLQQMVGGDEGAVKWRSLGMGARQSVVCTDGEATARLIYIPAGQAMPQHSHRGLEMTLVLQGAFRDEDGVFARGDIEIADEAVDHTPIAEPGADCICLIATDGRLKFNGLLPRIAQPFIGI
ncbi:ChrR family anti-sigma-E factor [Roseicyclus mahoneyensis]|uniref:ChrR-like anti-ECFsigma factor n=1 Tax=Roseicyclus mahoneyensis TaxID=164332 RepID=A0A316GHV7_9RHOB|nr:ChrR family anti-sigma-E factor [Roseicyclus mahoneyensis]PWK59751.1 ChrR-like anti-ECFsigma factor [Roseicyclus mahoneyensis]